MKPNRARIVAAGAAADVVSAATEAAAAATVVIVAAATLDVIRSPAGKFSVTSAHNPSHTKETMNFSQLGLTGAQVRVCESLWDLQSHTNTNKSHSDDFERRRRYWLCRNRHWQDRRISSSHHSEPERPNASRHSRAGACTYA